MSIDFKKAMLVPFSNEEWYKKIGIALLIFVPAILTAVFIGDKHAFVSLLGFLVTILFFGYAYISGSNEINDSYPTLPDWDFIKSFMVGIKWTIIVFAYHLILLPLAIIIIAVTSIVPTFTILSVILGIILFVFAYIIISIALGMFMENFELVQAFNFKKVWELFKVSSVDYIVYYLWCLLAGVIYGIVSFIAIMLSAVLGHIVSSILVQLISLLMILTAVNLLAQTYKVAEKKLEECELIEE